MPLALFHIILGRMQNWSSRSWQIPSFLVGCRTGEVPYTEFMRIKFLGTTASKQLEVVRWLYTSVDSVHSPDPSLVPRFTCLIDANVFF